MIRGIKQRAGVRTPRNVTGLNIFFRAVFIFAMGAAIAVVGLLGWKSWEMWQELNKPIEKVTPYDKSYQSKDYPGKKFMAQLLSDAPDSIDKASWTVSEDGKMDTSIRVMPVRCSQIAPSTAQLSYKTAKTDGVTATVMIYGAGQAKLQFDKYAKALTTCYPGAKTQGTTITTDGGFMMTRGDSILSVITDDSKKRDALEAWFASKLDESLKITSCAALDESSNDATRSFYYDANSYTGTIKTEKVTVPDQILVVSTPQVLTDHNMSVSKAFSDPQKNNPEELPLSPLPDGMKTNADLPKTPAVPVVSTKPSVPSTEKTVSYQIADETGPGCGWEWSGQKVPDFDKALLVKNQKTIVSNAKIELKNNITTYNQQIADWSNQTAMSMSFETSWDDYVSKTNTIYASWKDLNDRRESVRALWYAYVDDATRWKNWDQSVQSAQNQYDSSVKQCVADYGSRYGFIDSNNSNNGNNGSSSGGFTTGDDNNSSNKDDNSSNNDNNQQQNGKTEAQVENECKSATEKPAILSQSKPSRPVPPDIPSDLLLPESWPKDPLS